MTKICLFSYIDNANVSLKREISNIIGGYTEVSYQHKRYGRTDTIVTFIKNEHVKEFSKLKLQDDIFGIASLINIYELFLFNLSVEEREKLITNEEIIKHTRIVDHNNSRERIVVVSGTHGTYEELGR